MKIFNMITLNMFNQDLYRPETDYVDIQLERRQKSKFHRSAMSESESVHSPILKIDLFYYLVTEI